MNTNFWKDKKVFLTGHTGFKGSWLSLWLQKLGTDLTGFSKSIPTNPSLFQSLNLENNMNSIFGDVCNYEQLENSIKKIEPEIVIHMAAQSLVRKSYNEPRQTFDTNVMGTVNILESIRKTKNVKVVLVVTSDKCYQIKNSKNYLIETDPMGGKDPYSSSKGCAELITSSFRDSFFNIEQYEVHPVSIASARAGNVIGGGDWAEDRLIPDIIRSVMKKNPVMIRNLQSIRPWQFVLEPLNGYLTLIEKLWNDGSEFSGAWNFGPSGGETQTVEKILEYLSKLWPGKIQWQSDQSKNPFEEKSLKLNCNKAISKLNFNSKMNLELSLRYTMDWYDSFLQNSDMKKFSENQIEKYQSL